MTGPAGARDDLDEPYGPDVFAETAGAYVLGVLDRAERSAFDAHLAGCAACREAVDDVAHLPALLAAVPPGGLGDPPASVLSGLLAAVAGDDVAARRAVRRRRVWTRRAWTGGGLLGAAAAGFLVGAVVLPAGDGADGPGEGVTSVVLTTTASLPVSATVDLEPAGWGTSLLVTCSYDDAGGARGGPGRIEYALVVRDDAGNAQQVATWSAGPGEVVTVPAATALELDEIADLEMTSGGAPVLSAEL